jgi:hypothetical protein
MIFLFWLVGLLFVGLAIPLMLRKVRRNYLYGLRVPETLESEDVWIEANARSGCGLFWLGVGTILVSSILYLVPWSDPGHYALVCAALLLVGVISCFLRGVGIAREVKDGLMGGESQ